LSLYYKGIPLLDAGLQRHLIIDKFMSLVRSMNTFVWDYGWIIVNGCWI